jgi:hypothetical protein
MRYFLTAFIFSILFAASVFAQDTIVLNSGEKILAKHIHLSYRLHYKTYPGGMRDSIDKAKVNYVIHHSGWKIPMVPPPWYCPITFSPGIGLSAIQYKFKYIVTDTGANIISYSPVYSLNADYSYDQKFSVGFGVAWQTLKINPYKSYTFTYISSYYLVGTPGGFYTIPASTRSITYGAPDEQIVETLTRLNVGLRLLYHIRNDDVKDFYLGTRIGLSFWTDQSSPAGYNTTEGNVMLPSIQAFIGLRREINNYMGFYIEGGLGSPYFADGGIYFKVNTKGNLSPAK